ncbi:uncharacterized protein LOC105833183 [Monomorium pharaonis]|uniref:uncharacterized protein LOC105833183 n=1 Tax=Monomorium pharaonis TaxID=307658 RepID=UPI0017473C73|nr:uncharacterized protein LOC105833183 [Monomorium pharaonis]
MTETDNVKVISRPKPKVRFHQFSTGDDTQNVEREVFEQAVKEQAVLRANGPRIREIVSLKKPVRIVDLRKQSTNAEKAIFMSNCNTDVSSRCDDIQNVSLSEKNMPRVEDMTTLCDVNAIWNTKKSCNKILQLDKSLRDDAVKVCAKSLGQKGKENKGIPLKRVISNKNVSETRTENFQQDMQSLTKEKFKLFTNTKNNCMQKVNVQNFKRPKMTKLQSAPSIVKKAKNCTNRGKIFNTKPSTSCFMSRYKTVDQESFTKSKILREQVMMQVKDMSLNQMFLYKI